MTNGPRAPLEGASRGWDTHTHTQTLDFIYIDEFNSNFFSKVGIRDPLNFANGSKWYSETRQTGLQILVKSKLLVLAPSNMA